MNPYSIIKKPIITERTTILKETENKYVFMVDLKATKTQIKNALKELFNVKAEKVHTMIVTGKIRRVGKYSGYKQDWKKAIVKLASGQEIKILAENK
ncbi:MAG: 50S ribosomal protein L23 [Elusimicrobia bacterium RIFOXYA2_FULL_39_19]|nr:MAG: 50S ribosomal protein L23 [Elusimicrobia bacterium RIFOXYA2_FULL_39_19]